MSVLASTHVAADRLPWMISRGAGLAALSVMVVVILLGLLSAGSVWARLGRPQWKARAIAWHRPLAWTGLTAVILHIGLLYFDPWLKPGIQGLLAPFTLHQLDTRWWVELGSIALWCIVFALISFYARRSLREIPGGWKAAHRIGWLAGVLILAHALGSGTDLRSGWTRDTVIALAGILLAAFVTRLTLAGRKRSSSKA